MTGSDSKVCNDSVILKSNSCDFLLLIHLSPLILFNFILPHGKVNRLESNNDL